MTFAEFARYILHMECGERLELYAGVNRQTKECSRALSVKKEQWNDTPFYLLGGHGQEVRTINLADCSKKEFETACRMDPENPEYRQALAAFNNRGYRPQGYQTVSTSCGNDVCSNWCLAALCCNLLGGGGYFCLPCMF